MKQITIKHLKHYVISYIILNNPKKSKTFQRNPKEYIKCHFLCSNFIFTDINENDIDCLIDIINNEIAYKKTLQKKRAEP